MGDPGDGLGAAVWSGWIGQAPTGQDEAFLMLTTPDDRAPVTMPLLAETLGMVPGQSPRQLDTVRVQLLPARDLAAVQVGDQKLPYPVSREWAELALERGRVVFVVGTAPHPAHMDADEYSRRYGGTALLGFASVSR